MPGRFWNTALTIVSYGSGYAPLNFSWVLADHGGFTSQYPGRVPYMNAALPCGESIAKQLSVVVLPVLRPPPTNAPPFSRACTVTSTPLKVSVRLPNCPESVTRLLVRPNLLDVTS